jgi:hypothetical protein
VPTFGLRMVCTRCGIIGADARLNWKETGSGARSGSWRGARTAPRKRSTGIRIALGYGASSWVDVHSSKCAISKLAAMPITAKSTRRMMLRSIFEREGFCFRLRRPSPDMLQLRG